ncbi:MAG: flavodoxin family protein, partial [Deltaproteobacteria bacterium]|nr:flavodoxin family protein [Deltaproteobacteria bacterium]
MNILIVNGSPRGLRGNTGQMINVFVKTLRQEDVDTEIINLGDIALHPCTGCEACSRTGKCVIKDDVADIQKKMLAADGLVCASPNYIMNVSGHMKMFMDRCFTHIHCQTMVGKYGAALVSSAGPVFDSIEEYILSVQGFLGCWKVGSAGAAVMQLEDDDERENVFAEVVALAHKLISAIQSQQPIA